MPESSRDPDRQLRIRKYRNRRYYDSTHSRHLTLNEIHDKILEGYEIEVLDSQTGQDITAKVLAQIIIELDPPKLDVFPVAMLHRLLRTNEKLAAGFFDTFFSPLTAYLNSHRSAENYFRQVLGMGLPSAKAPSQSPSTPPAPLSAAAFSPAPFSASSPPAGDAAPTPELSAGELRAMIEELRSQLAELRASGQVGGRGGAGRKSEPRKRRKIR